MPTPSAGDTTNRYDAPSPSGSPLTAAVNVGRRLCRVRDSDFSSQTGLDLEDAECATPPNDDVGTTFNCQARQPDGEIYLITAEMTPNGPQIINFTIDVQITSPSTTASGTGTASEQG